MLPTFNPSGDIVIQEHVSVKAGWLQRGDVVVARSPTNPRHTICKRLLALEGDRVMVERRDRWGVLSPQLIEVPKGHVWIQGDNAHNSTDSRDYGPVPMALVRGRVLCKVFPFSEARFIEAEPQRARILGTRSFASDAAVGGEERGGGDAGAAAAAGAAAPGREGPAEAQRLGSGGKAAAAVLAATPAERPAGGFFSRHAVWESKRSAGGQQQQAPPAGAGPTSSGGGGAPP